MTSMTICACPSFSLIQIFILYCIPGVMVSLLANASHWVDNVTHLCYREEFNLTHESHWCGPKDECSQKGMILPIFNEVTWPIWLRIVLYFGGLLYSFVAVFIVADIFMCSIDSITSKTKEIIFDFRRRKTQTTPLRINNELVQITDTYKYLGINIDQNLDWHAHTDALIKKMNQRLYFMRKLKSFKVSNNIIKLFYLSSIQSIILFGISCWGGNLTQTDKTRIDRLIRKSGKMLNCTFQSFDHLFRETVAKKGTNIIKDPNHPLCNEFRVSARSGRLLAIPARTERYKNSFVPTVSRILRE